MGHFIGTASALVPIVCLCAAWRFLTSSPKQLPPGPRRWPFIGNLLDIPHEKAWETYTRLRAEYGDLFYLDALGTPLVIVSSVDVARDLLEKRGAIYSERPLMAMASDLCGFKDVLPMMPYENPAFRTVRGLLHRFMGGHSNIERFAAVEEEETARMMLRVFKDPRPESLRTHIQKTAGAIILKLTYGYTVREDNDAFIEQADIVVSNFQKVIVPGMYLVDIAPWMQYLPSWLPGMGFQRFAKTINQDLATMRDAPLNWAQHHQGSFEIDTFANLKLDDWNSMTENDRFVFSNAAATMYAGGSDTTVSAIYALFLALALYPEVQKKAQEEIDRVVGEDRLPMLKDRAHLPYIDALTKELLRWNVIGPLGVPHRLIEDDTYAGYFIPKGTIVVPNAHCMLQDPERYREPSKFNPERFLTTDGKEPEYDPREITFGFGRRICPGKLLADSSIFLACAMVAAVFDVSKVVENGCIVEPVHELVGVGITHPKEFPCAIKPRSERAGALVHASVELKQ